MGNMASVRQVRMNDEGAKQQHMSTSELRRGPGWWMDLDGQWKPPEEWPESSPPLPGWVRDAEGRWSEPALSAPKIAEPAEEVALTRPIPEVSMPPEVQIPKIPTLDSLRKPDPEASNVPREQLPVSRTGPPGTSPTGVSSSRESSLTFSNSTANFGMFDDDLRDRREAASAALLAAVTASMVAAGLVLLLLLL